MEGPVHDLRPGDVVQWIDARSWRWWSTATMALIVSVLPPRLDDDHNVELKWRWTFIVDGVLRSTSNLSELRLVSR